MQNHKTFFYFVIGIAIVGMLFVALALLRPHQAGIVVRVGHIGTMTHTSGKGRHKSVHKGFSADIKVQSKETGDTVTVYYRVRNKESIPKVGDEIEFAEYALTGYGPYPQKWAVRMGIALMALDALVFTGGLVAQRRNGSRPASRPPL